MSIYYHDDQITLHSDAHSVQFLRPEVPGGGDAMSDLTPHYADDQIALYQGHDIDVLRRLPSQSVNCVVTSPP